MEERYTISEFRARMGQNTPNQIRIDMGFAATHEDRLRLVERAIDWISQELTKNRHLKTEHSEDELTIEIVGLLRAMGFEAAHDTQYGGHCDIIVESREDFLWIAEAKIDTSNTWIFQGFNQLDTRYSTGLPGQDAGEMLIYCRRPRAADVISSWLEYLKEKRSDISVSDADETMSRRTQHIHEGTGKAFKVRHTPVTLYFQPRDKKSKGEDEAPLVE